MCGICVCVFLAVLTTTSTFAQQIAGSSYGNPVGTENEQNLSEHLRHLRTLSSSGQLKSFHRMDGNSDQKSNIGTVLAKYFQQSRKGSSGRYAVAPNRPVIDPSHRINDRDYMGWMDFGRRSAEEYEYSS
uniref:Cholecystokinin n=1 Tax=Geotrypetes seraphini TaxID=260995 RepID=A0A6P8QUC3_GEOSA|nr:cholecystokinin [Geotrypetes seraphini]